MDIVEFWDAWRTRQDADGYGALCSATPVDDATLNAYEAAFWRRGFELGAPLRQILTERGLIRAETITAPDAGWTEGERLELLSTVETLDDHDEALESAELIRDDSHAAHLLLFTTDHGDLEPAWAFDHRFGTTFDKGVGRYHQDETIRANQRLPQAFEGVTQWLSSRLDEIAARWRSAGPDPLAAAQVRPSAASSVDDAVLELEASVRDGRLVWGRLTTAWGTLAARTADATLLERIFDEVRRDRRDGRPGVDFQGLARGQRWPWDYPGPRDLVVRLDPSARRRLAHWALQRVVARGVQLDDPSALDALRGDTELSRDALRELSLGGWNGIGRGVVTEDREIDLATKSGKARYLRRALALAHTQSAKNHSRVLDMCALLGGGAFTLLDAWQHLELHFRRGTSIGEEHAVPEASQLVTELKEWITSQQGSQRELLDAIEREWLSKLATSSQLDRSQASAVIEKAVRSPKLAAPVRTLLDRLR